MLQAAAWISIRDGHTMIAQRLSTQGAASLNPNRLPTPAAMCACWDKLPEFSAHLFAARAAATERCSMQACSTGSGGRNGVVSYMYTTGGDKQQQHTQVFDPVSSRDACARPQTANVDRIPPWAPHSAQVAVQMSSWLMPLLSQGLPYLPNPGSTPWQPPGARGLRSSAWPGTREETSDARRVQLSESPGGVLPTEQSPSRDYSKLPGGCIAEPWVIVWWWPQSRLGS